MSTDEFPRRVLVPVDGSELSLLAARAAADVAKRAGAFVMVLHVIRSMQEYHRMMVAADALRLGIPRNVVKKILDQSARDARKIVQNAKTIFEEEGINVNTKVVRKIDPADGILEMSGTEFGLIIMGAHGEDVEELNALGSTARRVVRHSACATLVMKRECSFSNILVCVDGSRDSIEALKCAISLVRRFGSKITVLNVQEPRLFAFSRKAAGELGEQILAHARGYAEGDKSRAESLLEFGNPSDCIVSLAQKRNHDLIVLGRKGIGAAKRFLLGSVSDKVSRRAACSVLVVPTES